MPPAARHDGDQLFHLAVFINYNFERGWYFTSSPIMTADWEGRSGNQWRVPVGGGFGKIFRIGKQPLNANFQVFYNWEKPDHIGDWSMRAQLQFMFPKLGGSALQVQRNLE